MRSAATERNRGFTLLELMLTVAILAMVSMGIAAGLSAGIRTWESGERKMDSFQQKRILYERVFREISSAVNLRGKSENDEFARLIFNGEADAVTFISTAEAMTSPGLPMGLKETALFVDSGEGLMVQESIFSNKDFFNRSRGVAYALDKDVTGIKFKYLYLSTEEDESGDYKDGEWLDEWGPDHIQIEEQVVEGENNTGEVKEKEVKTQLPAAIEVTISVASRDSGQTTDWDPFIVPLSSSRVIGVAPKWVKK
jgi:prepilin-type N-terminal cleavage/methylation domain-containing protein